MFFDAKTLEASRNAKEVPIEEKHSFNPMRDRLPYQPNQAVDIGEAFASGVIPGNLSAQEVNYNHIANPADIIGRPRDEFEAMQIERNLLETPEDKPADVEATPPAPESPQE